MYAVIALQWHQYIVSQWLTFTVDQLNLDVGSTLEPEVLAVFNEDWSQVSFWTPALKASVVCTVSSHQRAKKIRVLKFKRKNRYERNFGHRSYQTTLTVTSLNG